MPIVHRAQQRLPVPVLLREGLQPGVHAGKNFVAIRMGDKYVGGGSDGIREQSLLSSR